jgi:hypothetical protein
MCSGQLVRTRFKPDDPDPNVGPEVRSNLTRECYRIATGGAVKKRSALGFSVANLASVTRNLNNGHTSITFFN